MLPSERETIEIDVKSNIDIRLSWLSMDVIFNFSHNSTPISPTEFSLRQSRDPSIVASFSLVLTRIRGFYVEFACQQHQNEIKSSVLVRVLVRNLFILFNIRFITVYYILLLFTTCYYVVVTFWRRLEKV